MCDEVSDGARCVLTPAHDTHQAITASGELKLWPNPDYVPPPKKSTKAQTMKDLDKYAGAVKKTETDAAALRAGMEALDTPHAWVQREPMTGSALAAEASAMLNSARRRAVFVAICEVTNATDDEVCVRLADPNVHAGRVASRRGELLGRSQEGDKPPLVQPLEVDGVAAMRPTRAGELAQVWTPTPLGWQVYREIASA